MKLIHLSDLHLGKRVNGYSMLEDQRYILNQILDHIAVESPQAVLLCGDIYDRTVPPEEAVELFDHFLVELSRRGIEVLLISGNHDSAERLAFGGRLMELAHIHLAPVYSGGIRPVTLEDSHGCVDFWPIPFLKPANVRRFCPEQELKSYTEAMGAVVDDLALDTQRRNVALVHQFLTGAQSCDSEERSVGGTDEVDAAVFDAFDYVALGHLHGPQRVGRDTVRYAGSPLKYSFSEARQVKSLTVVELGDKGEVGIRTLPLTPFRDLRRIRGSFAELIEAREGTEDYCELTLTDEEDVPDALARLSARYPWLMALRYDNTRTRSASHTLEGESGLGERAPGELFAEFYRLQNGKEMNEEQTAYINGLIEEIWNE
jgi:exonuclease SbcD